MPKKAADHDTARLAFAALGEWESEDEGDVMATSEREERWLGQARCQP